MENVNLAQNLLNAILLTVEHSSTDWGEAVWRNQDEAIELIEVAFAKVRRDTLISTLPTLRRLQLKEATK